LDSTNYTSYTVTKTGSGASGTWEINITGTAAKATGDANGNNIASTYLKLSGGTLTGAVTFANDTLNLMGDDCYIGGINKAGHIGIKGNNGNTGLFFITYN